MTKVINRKQYKKLDLKSGVDYIGVTVVFYCHDGQGRLLMHKRSKNCRDEIGNWDVGGGSMEFGEDFEEAVLREIKEEYSATPQEIKYLRTYNAIRQNGDQKTHWVALVYVAKLDPNEVKIGDPEKMDEIGWFSKDNLPEPIHSEFMPFFKYVKGEIFP